MKLAGKLLNYVLGKETIDRRKWREKVKVEGQEVYYYYCCFGLPDKIRKQFLYFVSVLAVKSQDGTDCQSKANQSN